MNPHGWRKYKLVPGPDGFYLAGMRMAWPTNTLRAECFPYQGSSGAVVTPDADRQQKCLQHLLDPSPSCGPELMCGIYVVRNRELLERVIGGFDMPFVVGCVAWGITGVYQHGWRAQYVRMEHIELVHEPRWTSSALLGGEAVDVDPQVLLEAALEQISERYQLPIKVAVRQAA